MNRRELLAAIGVGTLAATCKAGCSPPKPAENYLELRLIARRSGIPFEMEEFTAPGQSLGELRSNDERGVTLFLTHASKNPAAPKQLRLIVENSSKLERVYAAVKSCRAAGFAKVRYYGCIPPGCGITAGEQSDQKRHLGTEFKTDELEKILIENSQKC